MQARQFVGSLIGLAVFGILAVIVVLPFNLIHRGKPSPWVSQGTFTLRSGTGSLLGTYTARDPTVPWADQGYADVTPGGGDFQFDIGGDPGQETNVSQFMVLLAAYHGVGSYTLTTANGSDLTVSTRPFEQYPDYWGLDASFVGIRRTQPGSCVLRVTADMATGNPTVRRLTGNVSCDGLYDKNNGTTSTALSASFDVFAWVFCGNTTSMPCVSPQPYPTYPQD
jgi:hypothetical protein